MLFGRGNLKVAIANLRQSKWRSAFTMLGIVIGITSVITIVSLGEGLKQQMTGQIHQLGGNVISVRSGNLVNRGSNGSVSGINILALLSTSTLTNQDVQALSKIKEAQAVVPIDFVTNSAKGDAGSSNSLFVVGTTSQMTDVLHQKVEYGDFFNNAINQNSVVIGANVAHQLFGELNPVGHSLSINGTDFAVYGVLAQAPGGLLSSAEIDFNSAVFMPLSAALQLTNNHTNILQILVKSKTKNLNATVSEAQKALLKTHQGVSDFTVLTPKELSSVSNNTINNITEFISAIAAISLLVGGISIMDIMWVSVSERTREIGVRKAVGATDRQVLNQFLVEGLVLCVTGGIIGFLFSLLVNLILRLYTSLHPAITIPVVILAVGVSVSVGVILSVAPALKAAHKRPIDALRGE